MLTKQKVLTSVLAITAGAMLIASGTPAAQAQGNQGEKLDNGNHSGIIKKIASRLPKFSLFGSGDVVLKSAEITGISGTTLNAKATWNSQVVNFVITTNANTKVKIGKTDSALANLKVGDKIALHGTLTNWNTQPTFYAKQIIVANGEAKPEAEHKAVIGKVVSVNANTNTIVVTDRKNQQQTIAVNASTTIKTGATTTGTLADIQPNQLVGVRGAINTTGTFIATKIVVGWQALRGVWKSHF